MYRILVIEDEYIIRKALIREINWREIGCEVTGEADDGLKALECIGQIRPDIIISDIKMEKMDGIEVTKRIRELRPGVEIIFITGYGDVKYAQQAIKLGASDFILKPINPDTLLKAVKKACDKINTRIRKKEEFNKLQKIVEKSIPDLSEKFLFELANNNAIYNKEEFQQRLDFLDIHLQKFIVLAVEIDNYETLVQKYNEKTRQTYKLGIKNKFLEMFETLRLEAYYIYRSKNLDIVIMEDCDNTDTVKLFADIQNNIMETLEVSISIGLSCVNDNLPALNQSVEEAVNALNHKFYTGDMSIVFYKDIKLHKINKKENQFVLYQDIANSVSVGDTGKVKKRLEGFLNHLRNSNDENYIRKSIMELVIVIQGMLRESRFNLDEIISLDSFYTKINKSRTINELSNIINNLAILLTEQINRDIKSNNRLLVEKILEYIKKNYHNNISLNDLSRLVFMNPNYISRLIKQETGENYSEILTKIRIGKSKEFLKNIKYKTYEVAKMIGINDPRYFSQMFKRYTGLTPKEYRKTIQNKEVKLTNKK